jgi:hypothetical protein
MAHTALAVLASDRTEIHPPRSETRIVRIADRS